MRRLSRDRPADDVTVSRVFNDETARSTICFHGQYDYEEGGEIDKWIDKWIERETESTNKLKSRPRIRSSSKSDANWTGR